ncbi:TolB family protein [Nonomuraea sp. NPDC004354]
MRTEEDLVRALRQAAERAPQHDLSAAISVRRRRRTRQRWMGAALAVAAVIGVAGAGTLIARGIFTSGGEGGVASPVSGSPGEAVASVEAPPRDVRTAAPTPGGGIEDVWPKAFFTMPAKNAEGWRYRPITGISPTEVLLNAESSFEKAGRIEIYDSETGTFRTVADVPATPGLKRYFPQSAAVDGQSVVWWAVAGQVREIWTAPLAGGEARMVATFTGEHLDIEAIAVKGEHIYWSEQNGTVWRLLQTGGDPEKIADGLHLISWPWASDVGERDLGKNQTKVVNLETGETRQVTAAPNAKELRCGPVWCLGAGLGQRLDGSDVRTFDGFVGGLSPYPILDRYVFLYHSVVDLEAGTILDLPDNPDNWSGVGTSSAPSTIKYWGAAKGDKPDAFRMVNLAAAH